MNSVNTQASKTGGSQIFITTHQPYLVDALDPKEVWILEKGSGWLFNDPAGKQRSACQQHGRGRLALGWPVVQRLS